MDPYPHPRQILRVVFPALLVAQFLIWPLVGQYSPRAGLVAAELVIVWLMALFIRRHRLAPEDLLLLNATPPYTLVIVAVGAAGASLLAAEFDLFCIRLMTALDLPPPLLLDRNLLEMQVVRSLPELSVGLTAVVLVPALCEEIFFRGFVFTGIFAHYGARFAVGGSALLFALAHLDPWHLPALLLFGLFLGLLVCWTHSVYPAVLAHSINNLLSFAGVNLRAHWGWEGLMPRQHLPLLLIFLAFLLLVGSLFLVRRQPTIMPLLSWRHPSAPPIRPLQPPPASSSLR